MKALRNIITCMLLAIAGNVLADNLQPVNVEVAQGERATVSVSLDNPSTAYIMVEFWMTLPQGVTIPVDEDGYFMAEGNSERFKRTHVLEVSQQGGNYHFLIYSSRNEEFKGTSGELFHFTVEAAANAVPGNYTAKIFNQLYNDSDKKEYTPEDVTFGINITGDVIPTPSGNLSVENIELAQGERKVVSVALNNPDTEFIMVEFWLTLPQGVTIPTDEEGYLMAEGNAERFKKSHSIEVTERNGNYHFLIYSSKNEAFNGTSGELFQFTVEAAANAVPGNYSAKISKQLYNDINKTEYSPEDVTFDINITGTVTPTPSGNLSIENLELAQGERKVVSVALDNPDTEFIMVEFWMSLPQGLTIPVDEDGYFLAEGNSERFKKTHVLEVSNQEGYYHFLIYSSRNEAFKGTSGELFNFTVEAATNAVPGNYTAKIFNQLFNDINKDEYKPEDVTFNIGITESAPPTLSGNLSVEDVELTQGEKKVVSVALDNPDTEFIMVEFWLTLPKGVTIPVDEDGYLMAEGNSERFKKSHSIEVTERNGNYHFLIYSSKNEAFNGTSGELFHFTVEAAANAAPGNHTAKISHQLYNDINKNEYTPEDVTFGVNISEPWIAPITGSLSVENQKIIPGERKVVSVALDNPDSEFIMLEFWMNLPQGITIPVDEDGYFMAEGNSERFKKTHVLEVSNQEGYYHFLIYSSRNEAFKGTSGELFNFTIEAANDVELGNYTATIFNQLFNDINKREYTPEDVSFSIFVDSGEEVSITNVNMDENAEQRYYNLQGIPVTTPKHGVYIRNGKKIVVK